MKIALIGYGKMGKAIESIALAKGHEIVAKIDMDNQELLVEEVRKAEVAIEFTSPHSAVENLKKCFDVGVPTICGSTGWLEAWDNIVEYCKKMDGAFLYASNFSIGVNIFFELNKQLASLMANRSEYEIKIEEIHHTQKKDAPSGTAITIAEGILSHNPNKKTWVAGETTDENTLEIKSIRQDPAPGTHLVTYHSAIDDIEIIHTAHSRIGFAHGAVMAAEYIAGKKGIYSMKDVINLK
jgi:4-hydroxy-tetrahydrodipicolinate reductase